MNKHLPLAILNLLLKVDVVCMTVYCRCVTQNIGQKLMSSLFTQYSIFCKLDPNNKGFIENMSCTINIKTTGLDADGLKAGWVCANTHFT